MEIENKEVVNDDVIHNDEAHKQESIDDKVEKADEEEEPESMLDVVSKALDEDDEEPVKQKTEPVESDKDQKKPDEQPAVENEGATNDVDVPEGLSDKAQERFRALANRNKELEALSHEWVQTAGDVQEFKAIVQEAGVTPDEVMQLFDYGKSIKHGDFKTAERYLREQVLQFQILTGTQLNISPYEPYDDIKRRVDDMSMDEATAAELARSRYLAEQQQKNTQAYIAEQQKQQLEQQYQQQQAARHEQVKRQATLAVNDMAEQWAKTDLLWSDREKVLLRFIDKEVRSQPPEMWQQNIRAFYEGLKLTQPAKIKAPISGSGVASSGKRVPNSMLDAVNLAFAEDD